MSDMPISTTWIVTTWIAIYAAGLSTIVFIWNLIKHFRDIGRMRLNVMIGRLVGYGISKPQWCLVYTVTNVGKKALVIKTAAGENRDGTQFIINAPELPRKLEPTEYVTIKTHDLKTLKDVKSLFVFDSLDRKSKATRKQMQRIRKDLDKHVK